MMAELRLMSGSPRRPVALRRNRPYGPNHARVGAAGRGRRALQGLIRAGYVYRNDENHILTDKGRDALARSGVAMPPAPNSQ
jgi:ribosomal protein S19E (S16A)